MKNRMHHQARIAIFPTQPSLHEKAQQYASRLALPIVFSRGADFNYLLVISPEKMSLIETIPKGRELYLDFLSGKAHYRQKKASLKKELLARALGLKPKERPCIVDATGGFAQDSLILATLGYPTIILERSGVIYTLLKDGCDRASSQLEALKRLTLIHADAIVWLKNNPQPDLIYLDPMFPNHSKSALARKQLQFFQRIVGQDDDASLLFETALACARQRVVVKRPRLASSITEQKPTYCLAGSSCRFDVYLK